MDFSLVICHWNSHEAQPFKCVNQMRSCNVQFASVTRNPEMTALFAVSPYANLTQLPWCLIQSRTMTVFIRCPTGFAFQWAVGLIVGLSGPLHSAVDVERRGLMKGWPEQGERRKLVSECNQREATCLGLPVMTKYIPMYVLCVLPVCVNYRLYICCVIIGQCSLWCILILMGNVWHWFLCDTSSLSSYSVLTYVQ